MTIKNTQMDRDGVEEMTPAVAEPSQEDAADESVSEPSENTRKPELVIALAAPVGTDLRALRTALEEQLKAFEYQCFHIRVSELIKHQCEPDLKEEIEAEKEGRRISRMMLVADKIRAAAEEGDALVPLMATAIRAARNRANSSQQAMEDDLPAENTCYILDSLKHPHEVETLRRIYGDNFLLISGFSSRDHRRERLCDLISKSHLSTRNETFAEEADNLIETDAKRPGSKIGQSLRDTFPLADFFIRVNGDFSPSLERFLNLYFGSPYVTPLPREYFMFEATSKALRSSDLSRQVGAVVVDSENHLLASGCNEVPLAGGGTYWPGMASKADNRDYAKGRDFNAVKKFEIINELVDFLHKKRALNCDSGFTVDSFSRELVFGKHKEEFKDLRVSNLIEFGRVVHAEMNAITEAARRGVPLRDSVLYCTTFPCHMCARHIISSGIQRVVYIEPYPKSMTEELFRDSVVVDREATPGERRQRVTDLPPPVSFEPFEGVAPSLYASLFRAGPGSRKNAQGYTVTWSKREAKPKVVRSAGKYLDLEQAIARDIENIVKVSKEALRKHEKGDQECA